MPVKAKATSPAEKRVTEITVVDIQQSHAVFKIIGTSPLIFNAVGAKAKRELLMPTGRKSEAEKAASQKHDPLAEYIKSTYKFKHEDMPTQLFLKSEMFKSAMMTAALDVPGVFKTTIGRLIWVVGDKVPVWGEPCLKMDVVRMADQKRTPDIRTRAILTEWATKITIAFQDLIKPQSVVNLLAAAGVTAGVGDYRQEKGKGSYGQYQAFAGPDHPLTKQWDAIIRSGGRKVQDAALANPGFYDEESEELFGWFYEEKERRAKAGPKKGPKVPKEPTPRRRGPNGEAEAVLATE